MAGVIKAIRGMHDTLPGASRTWQRLEQTVMETVTAYGYQQIRLPILEKTELFERSIGETSDIVSKEMYTFTDRNGDMLTLRPEGTAGCVRAVLEHGLYQTPGQRYWYSGPMFRHERPQKGRLRQFHQIGVESFGLPGPDIDAEMIILCARIWRALGLTDLTLELNSLGSAAARTAYHKHLVNYFSDHHEALDEDSRNRLDKNPLRILDSKNPDMQGLIMNAPSMSESMDDESRDHFQALLGLLDAVDIPYRINNRLVRGLDYYNRTVFEWVTTQLGAQGTICAGGRYDGMVEHFGGPATPAIGFAMGMERLVSLLLQDASETVDERADVYFVVASDQVRETAFRLAEQLRTELPGLRLLVHCGGGSFKSQFKKADKSGARLALIMGDSEATTQCIGVKHLRDGDGQLDVGWDELADTVRKQLAI